MNLTLRQKNWLGAIISFLLQAALFIPLNYFFDNLISSLVVITINVVLAASYKNTNPYLKGARWGTFFSLSFVSYSRHAYWYCEVLNSFIRLRDFNHPVGLNEELFAAPWSFCGYIAVSSFALFIFYTQVVKWPEWTDRWASMKYSAITTSVGTQSIILVAIVYPTPLTMTSVLFFASILAPIMRRQVRLTHVIFLLLVPMFSLGCLPLAIFWSIVCGLIFIYFTSWERLFTSNIASLSFFQGMVFIGLVVSLAEGYALDNLPIEGAGIAALVAYLLTLGAAFALIYRGQTFVLALQEWQRKTTPKWLSEASWWHFRDGWIDREIDWRQKGRFNLKDYKFTLGLLVFGPKHWLNKDQDFPKAPIARINLTPTILALCFYSIYFFLDAVVRLTPGNQNATLLLFIMGFGLILLVVGALIQEQRKERNFFQLFSRGGTFGAVGIFVLVMFSVVYTGLAGNQTLQRAAQQANQSQAVTVKAQVQYAYPHCPCRTHPDDKYTTTSTSIGFP